MQLFENVKKKKKKKKSYGQGVLERVGRVTVNTTFFFFFSPNVNDCGYQPYTIGLFSSHV